MKNNDDAQDTIVIEQLPIAAIDIGARIRLRDRIDPAFVESIRRTGIIHPLIVTANGDRFWLLAGMRRLVHAQEAGLAIVPVRVLPAMSQIAGREVEIGENSFREAFSPLDKARAFEERGELGWSQKRIAAWWTSLTGDAISRSSVAQHLKLLDLSVAAQAALADGALDFTAARHLAYEDLIEYEEELLAEAYRRAKRTGRPTSWDILVRFAKHFQPDDELREQYDAAGASSLPVLDTSGGEPEPETLLQQIEHDVNALRLAMITPKTAEALLVLASYLEALATAATATNLSAEIKEKS